MKKIYSGVLMVLMLAVLAALTLAPYTALAQNEGDVPPQNGAQEETIAQPEEETRFSFSDYFEQNWLDKLVQYAFVLLGAVTAVAATLRRVRTAHKLLCHDSGEIKEMQKELLQTGRQLEQIQDAYGRTLQALDEALGELAAMRRQVACEREQSAMDLGVMKKAMRLAYGTDPRLVQSGYAKEIVSLLEEDHETLV